MKKKRRALASVLILLCMISVLPADAATAVKLNYSEAVLYVGQTLKLKLSGKGTVDKWSSSDKTVVSVNAKGKVTAKKTGYATITAKVGKKKYSCQFAVKADPVVFKKNLAKCQKLLDAADARKESIRNSKTTLVPTGTVYYVSSSTGDDANDGLSPETAWKTLKRVEEYDGYKKNDTILLKRGDEFRGGIELEDKPRLTLSAYGEGPKPLVMGSPENGAGEEKWSLMPGTKNIWVYYHELEDCGSIVFDAGAAVADKMNVYWNGKIHTKAGTDIPFNPAKDLNDMTLFNDIDYTEWAKDPNNYNVDGNMHVYSADLKGKLYLRCDAGNPGKLYRDIEFGIDRFLISMEEGTIDNLCIYYAGGSAVGWQFNDGLGCAMTNCEIAFTGDSLIGFDRQEKNAITAGGAAYFLGYADHVVQNNYIHDQRQEAFTIETGWDGVVMDRDLKMGGLTCSGNVFERCQKQAIGLTVFLEGNHSIRITDVEIFDNYFLDIGYNYKETDPRNDPTDIANGCLSVWCNGDSDIGSLDLHDNVFFRAYNQLFTLSNIGEGSIHFDNNTYVQGRYSEVLQLQYKGAAIQDYYAYDEAEFADCVKNVLGDKRAKVYIYYNSLEDAQMERARELGLIPSSAPTDLSRQMTSKQMTALLTKVVNKKGTKAQKTAWKNVSKTASSSTAKLSRIDGMVAVYEMAYVLGDAKIDGSAFDLWDEINEATGNAWADMDDNVNWNLYSNLDENGYDKDFEGLAVRHLAYLYAMEKFSADYLFAYDSAGKSMHCGDAMTWEMAIKAAVRYYDSTDPLAFRYYLP